MNLAILSLNENDFKTLLINGALNEIQYKVKILPNDNEILDNEIYKGAVNKYRKAREYKEKIAFELTTNK